MGRPCHLEDPTGQGDRLLTYVLASGGPPGQTQPGPGERALNQPRLYPSSKTVWRCCGASNDRLITTVLRKLSTGRP